MSSATEAAAPASDSAWTVSAGESAAPLSSFLLKNIKNSNGVIGVEISKETACETYIYILRWLLQ
eukprot:7189532-Pyramimonas_sp.AAC.1